MTVTIEVSRYNPSRPYSRAVVDSVLESTVSLAQQDRNITGVVVRHGEVQFTVAVEVARRHCNREIYRAVVNGALEGAVAIAEQYRDGIDLKVPDGIAWYGEVRVAIAIEIAHRN